MSETITIHGFSVEQTTFEVDAEEHAATVASDNVGNEYDHHLSDMDGETVVVQPDGTVINPYGPETELFALVEPILKHVPTWRVEQYVASRRSDEE